MQHSNSDDPWGFWEPEPTRQLKRTQVGIRVHGETRMVPVVQMARTREIPRQRSNPLAARVFLLIGGMVLLVPVALSLRTDKPQVVRAVVIETPDPVFVAKFPPPAPTEVSRAPLTAAPTTVVVTTAAPTTPAPTEAAVVVTAAPTQPPTTAAKPKQATPKPPTTLPKPAAAAQSATKTACPQTYTVVSGDAWSAIAARAKVPMKDLLAANGATINTMLFPGDEICLPQGAVAPGPPPAATQPATTQPKPAAPAPTQPATTPPSTAPAGTQPASPANTYSPAQVTQIIRDVWPDNLEDEAIRIATRESGLNPTVKNYCCYGLFQIYYTVHKTWLAGMGVTSAAQLYDPRVNATAALELYTRSGGWGPWT